MTMNEMQLNLARKWRSKTFDELVGQDVSVKMLKNSLYLGSLFPVYLLWGQRGTGKTSLARIFAAAINCAALEQFRKNPRSQQLPCLECPSCRAMSAGKHPDFIELDAASNTGVDHVRTIIESASLMPVMGSKKIYLIDEAHMLSKAAFNALLKMLEEPPAAALFMLATTDPYKIIDTVRSRCFQLPLRALDQSLLTAHLLSICTQEAIPADKEALALIAHESEGSARDALNILEQVRYASGTVNSDSVRLVLGRLDDAFLLTILQAIITKDQAVLMHCLSDPVYRQSDAEYVWQRLVEFIRMLIWKQNGVSLSTAACADQIAGCARRVSLASLLDMLNLFYQQEPVFVKTANKQVLLELILLKLCKSTGGQTGGAANMIGASVAPVQLLADEESADEDEEVDDDDTQDVEIDESKAVVQPKAEIDQWNGFVQRVEECHDVLLSSIVKQACFKEFKNESHQVCIAFGGQFSFFKEWLEQTRNIWQPLLEASFGTGAQCVIQFDESLVQEPQAPSNPPTEVAKAETIRPAQKVHSAERATHASFSPRPFMQKSRPVVRVPALDARLYPRAQMILNYFPGVLKEG